MLSWQHSTKPGNELRLAILRHITGDHFMDANIVKLLLYLHSCNLPVNAPVLIGHLGMYVTKQ